MKYLMSQMEFEQLIGRGEPTDAPQPRITVVYFTASWCGACRRLNLPALEEATPTVNWLKCDIDQNDYTAGYCGIRSIPSFLIIVDKNIAGTLQDNDNARVITWVKSFL